MSIEGSITALVTPMKETGDLDFNALENLINFQIESGIKGLVAVGTTGESATIDIEDHIKIIEFFVKKANGKVSVIAGTGANSTHEAIHLTNAAKDVGASAALLVSPYYNKPPQEGIYQHHMKIADSVDIPQILYNVPSRTASFIESPTVAKLASHENIIGIKDATGDLDNLKDLKRLCRLKIESGEFFLFSGDDFSSFEFMKNGGHGTISVTSNVAPKIVSDICELISTDLSKAEELDKSLIELNASLFLESNPIPVKWALYKMGIIEKGIRLPLVELDNMHKKEVEKSLQNLNLLNL